MKFPENSSCIHQLQNPKECPYFVTYLRLHFFLLPFRIEKSYKSGEYYTSKRSSGQKIFQFCIHIFILFYDVIWISSAMGQYLNYRHDISSSFYVVSKIATAIATPMLQWIVWTKQEMLEKLIQLTTVQVHSSSALKAKVLTVAISVGMFFTSCSHGILSGYTLKDSILTYQFLRSILSPVCSVFNLHPIEFLAATLSEENLKRLGLVIFSFSYAIFNTMISSMIVLALMFKTSVEEKFLPNVEKANGNITMVLEQYKKMKELSYTMKMVCGHFVLFFYIAILTFFAELPQLLLIDSETSTRLIMGFYIVVVCTGLGISAHANAMAEDCLRKYTMYHHCHKEGNTIERLQLIALTQDMEAEPIGISCYFFTITKRFLSSTFGLVVTYSLLIFQSSERVFWEH